MRRALALAAVVLATAAANAGCTAAPRDVEHTITIRYSAFDPAVLTVPAGVPVTFVLVNEDPIDHEWLVGDETFHEAHRTGTHPSHGDRATEVTVPALETVETTITFDEPGRRAYVCHLPAHEAYGMIGTLVVGG